MSRPIGTDYKLKKAMMIISSELAQGRRLKHEVINAGLDEGVGYQTMMAAARKLGVKKRKFEPWERHRTVKIKGGNQRRTAWFL